MRVLLSDGSGLTARQCATLLGRAGHEVEVLTPAAVPLARWTRHVARLHRVPPYGRDPLRWWEAALQVVRRRRPDVLLATQEQVAVISLRVQDLVDLGVSTAVPPFSSLAQVQDKLAADRTLRRVGLPRADSWVAATPEQLRAGVGAAFLKAPIGTASAGVIRVGTSQEWSAATARLQASGAFAAGGVLVESPVTGTLVMVQAVFDTGRLVAVHANERTREGASGGASLKTSRAVGDLADAVQTLGSDLAWHGALSLDAIAGPDGPVWIDVNPRLVEPGNAAAAGVDLVAALLGVALGGSPPRVAAGVMGVRTSQALLAVLGAAQHGGRLAVGRELLHAVTHKGPFWGCREELTPPGGDWRAAVPVLAASIACLASPRLGRTFTSGAVSGYALTPQGWGELLAAGEGR